jgi:redox-sensitive bicupin YhaK (pirin superfamily)
MIKSYPYNNLAHHDFGWLDARHHFSFGEYRDPKRMGFGALRVINDDIIKAGAGFDTHPHKDMEIITYVRKGAITHRDSQGNVGRTEAGNVQVMSAGTGIYHSEFNLESKDTTLFQIWINPRQKNIKPQWDAMDFPRDYAQDKLTLLVSGHEEDRMHDALYIHQDARIYGGRLKAGQEISHPIHVQAYLLVSEGEIEMNGHAFKKGDGVEITDIQAVSIKAINNAEIVVIDVPKTYN